MGYIPLLNHEVKYMPTKGKITKTDLIYTAGIIDGEGSIVITKARRNHLKYKCPHHILMVTCANTYRPIIDWLSETFGASKTNRKRRRNHPYWKISYEWQITANKALVFLKMIYPYLRIKKVQATLAIKFQTEKMQKRTFVNSGTKKGHTLTPETLAFREKIYEKMHFLNTGNNFRRGPKPRLSPVETERSSP